MKFTQKSHAQEKIILANDHYVALPTVLGQSLAVDGIVKAGTIVPANDATAAGVVLYDVKIAENPNGAIVIHGFIEESKLPEAPTAEAKAALKQITFVPKY